MSAKRRVVSDLCTPRGLVVSNTETTNDSSEIDPSGHLGRRERIRIEGIGLCGDRVQHGTESGQTPAEYDTDDWEMVLESLPNDDQADDDGYGGDVVHGQTCLGFKYSLVLVGVAMCKIIVEEVTKHFAEKDGDDGDEIQKAHTVVVVAVSAVLGWRSEEDGRGDVDADGPGKDEKTVSEKLDGIRWVVVVA